jgi:fumarylacetoacetate (FAA) hydrolase
MKLATFKDGSRDGQLVVVSRDLATAHFATGIASRLQQVLDDWNFLSPQLEDLYVTLNQGKARHAFEFVPAMCMAPLPRAYHWADSSGAHGPGDHFLGACDDAVFADATDGVEGEAVLAAVTGDLPLGATREQAIEGIRLVMLALDWRTSGKPPATFGPAAVTPDEFGPAWQHGRVRLPLTLRCNSNDAQHDATFALGERIARICGTRAVRAGSIVAGSLQPGAAPPCVTLHPGSRVVVETAGADGQSVFGAIDQKVVAAG